MNQIASTHAIQYRPAPPRGSSLSSRTPVLLLITDDTELADQVQQVSAFLDVEMTHLDMATRLLPLLRSLNPMAIIAGLDARFQDGFHVMKVVGAHDPSLPLLLLSEHDESMAGAVDAVEQLWALNAVRRSSCLPGAGELIEFVCEAGRQGECLSLMPV